MNAIIKNGSMEFLLGQLHHYTPMKFWIAGAGSSKVSADFYWMRIARAPLAVGHK